MLLVVGDGGGVFGILRFAGRGLLGERQSLGRILRRDEDGEIVGSGGVGFIELESFAKLFHGFVGLAFFGK